MWPILGTFAVLAIFASPASAADPAGQWRVEEGTAHIQTVLCDGRLWGVVSWEQKPGGIDRNNPDPSLRGRPTLGLPIILGMRPTKPGRWEGGIYNAKDGKTYQAAVTLKEPDLLEVEGCVLSGWICSGEEWTRVKQPPKAVKSNSPTDLCLRLGAGSEQPRERRAK